MLLGHIAQLRTLAEQAGPLVPKLVEQQRLRFMERWKEAMALTEGATLPEAAQDRALTEATAFAIRIDVAEEITRLNSNSTGKTNDNLDNIKDYSRLLSKYIAVQASILQLYLCVDEESILFLASNGYKIDTSSNTAYRDTLKSAQRKAANVVTKIESKYKEIMASVQQMDPDAPAKSGIETMLASVSAALGFAVDSSVTLARFNEYSKIIKKRVEAQKNKS